MAQLDHQGLSPGSAWLPARAPSRAHRGVLPTPAPLQVPRGGGCCLPAPRLVLGDPALALEVAPGAQGTRTLALTLKSGHRPSLRGQGDACCRRQWGSRELGPHCPALVVGQGRLSLLGVTTPSTSGGQGLGEGGQPGVAVLLAGQFSRAGDSPTGVPLLILPQP